MVYPHSAEFIAFGFERHGAHGWQERREQRAVLAGCAPRPELVTQEREAGVLVVTPTVGVLAIDDPSLVRVKPQAHLLHPLSDRAQHFFGLTPGATVHHSIVG